MSGDHSPVQAALVLALTITVPMQQNHSFLNMTAEDFLKEIWGNRPLFLPQSIRLEDDVLSPDELAGMAGEDYIESRLITHNRQSNQWRLAHGPFDEGDFAKLPAEDWTLLVQDVDKFIPEVAAILDKLDFLPRYWLDDIMVSYATKGGSVGAHLDRYHVFLVQAAGSRRWQIEETKRQQEEYIPDIDIRLLKQFEPTQSFDVKAGDVLYIPPHVAHHGVALDNDCMTYSIGFRAPSRLQMMSALAQYLEQKGADEDLLEDPHPHLVKYTGQLQAEHVRLAQDFLTAAIQDTPSFTNWLGCFLSEPKFRLDSEPTPAGDGRYLVRDENCRAYYYEEGDQLTLFVDGRSIDIPAEDHELAKSMCNHRRVTRDAKTLPTWLSQLIQLGYWY